MQVAQAEKRGFQAAVNIENQKGKARSAKGGSVGVGKPQIPDFTRPEWTSDKIKEWTERPENKQYFYPPGTY